MSLKWRYARAVAMLGEEAHGFDAGVDEVTGVDAQLQAVVDGVGQNALDLVLELDVRAAVLMQHRRETVLDGDGRRLTDPRSAARRSRCLRVVVAASAAPGGRTTFVADLVDHDEIPSVERGDPLARLSRWCC